MCFSRTYSFLQGSSSDRRDGMHGSAAVTGTAVSEMLQRPGKDAAPRMPV
jgi:hypothetical protein